MTKFPYDRFLEAKLVYLLLYDEPEMAMDELMQEAVLDEEELKFVLGQLATRNIDPRERKANDLLWALTSEHSSRAAVENLSAEECLDQIRDMARRTEPSHLAVYLEERNGNVSDSDDLEPS